MKIEYDRDKHQYFLDGKPCDWPSVTEILPRQQFYVTDEQLEAARLDGVERHGKVRMYYDSNGDDFGDPFLEQYHAIINENAAMLGRFVCNEQSFISIKHKFTGTPDTIYEHAIIDLKRSKGSEKIHSLQIAGYNLLLHEAGIPKKKKWLIIYEQNGKLKIKNVFNPQAEAVFLALRKMYDLNQTIENYLKS